MSLRRHRPKPPVATRILSLLAAALTIAGPGLSRAAGGNETSPAGAVSALGRIEPEHGVILLGLPSTPQAISGSVVHRLMVEAGDNVTAGQVLAETDSNPHEQASVEVAKAELELAARQSEVAAGQEQDACSRADVARRTATRRTNLKRSGAASDEEADVAAADAKALSGSCASASMATKAAAAAVEVARAQLHRAETALERTFVRSPTDGRVLRIVSRPGELVALQGLLEIGRVSRMYAIAEVYETDIGRVRKGQKATATSKALDAPLTGVVDHVRLQVRKQDTTGTDPAARKDARIVEVEVLLDHPEKVASLTHLQVEVLIQP
jgi:HlyD family secretion protein